MRFSAGHSLFFFIGLSAATYICDASNAKVAGSSDGSSPVDGDGSGGGSDLGVPVDPSAVLPAIDIGAGFAGLGDGLLGLSGKRSVSVNHRLPRLFARDASSIECSDAELCYNFAGTFLCIDSTTYNFEDSDGGSGNLDTGIYTMEDGEVTTLMATDTAFPTPTGESSNAKSTGTTAGPAFATATGGSGTATDSAHASTATGAGSRVYSGVDYVVLGLLAAVGVARIFS